MESNLKYIILSQLIIVLFSVTLYGSLFYDVKSSNAKLRSENVNLRNQMRELREMVGADSISQGISVINSIKRLAREVNPSQSATDILADALTELIEKKLYSLMECSRGEHNNSECSLKPGPKGDKGSIGEQGKDGPKGIPGVQGVKGEKGQHGYPGYKGDKGYKGEMGSQGTTGHKGERGFKGERGQHGYPGHKGDIGPPGPVGIRGPKGDIGLKGYKGEMGSQGATGRKGEHGLKGEKGQHGYPGYKGDIGAKGNPGIRGLRGYKGEQGMKGIQGERGYPGHKGEKGAEHLIPSETCGGPGWRRVGFINMTDPTQNCPQGLQLTSYSNRSCGRAHTGTGQCSSVTFPVGAFQYTQVCGRAKAYHWGYLYSFHGHNVGQDINGGYVDGISLTHGSTRKHIWTFAAGHFQGSSNSVHPNYRCPCDEGNSYQPPAFVGNDYFCDSASLTYPSNLDLYPNDPLWDGKGCISSNPCCQYNNPPWFKKILLAPTFDDIEMRLCIWNPGFSSSNIAIEQVELYVN